MAAGVAHYKQAEGLIEQATARLERSTEYTYREACEDYDRLVALAQVHATLALAAAQTHPDVML